MMDETEKEIEKARRRGEQAERMEWLCRKVQDINNKLDRISNTHEDRLEEVERLTKRHSWYWTGLTGILSFLGAAIALTWNQVVRMIVYIFK